MQRLYRQGRGTRTAAALLLLTTLAAHAGAAPQTLPADAPAAEPQPVPAGARTRDVEGAIGLVLANKPAFSGSSDRQWKPELAGFLRWGRITVTGQGGFTTSRNDEVERGLDALLIRREGLRVNLSLRYDPGRSESESDQLRGLGDIRGTVRARLGLRWTPAPGWSVGLASSFDALNRVGGYVVNAGVQRTFALDARQRLILGTSITGAGDRYMQTWYGITPEQSAASGYPVYRAAEGLRDVGASATWRIEIDPQWAAFAGASATRLLGPAAASPLAHDRNGFGVSAGIARRFQF
jgi:outer membrane scaffolding protein for murein synthesis (MipA/OmpV family)